MEKITGKKIAVVGLGIEGKDVIRYLLQFDNQITLFDQKLEEDLDFSEVDKDKIHVVCGPDYLMDGFKEFDYIFRSPGIRPDKQEFLEAKKSGAKVTSAMEVFFDVCPAKIIGVTGTKGKGTTSTLIYDVLKEDGKDVYLVGNIGIPYLELLSKLTKESWIVLELSSFHLFDLKKSPHIAVVLNITVDHLDWHKNREEYVNAKANIVRYQNMDDFVVLNFDYETPRSFGSMTKAQVFYFSKSKKVRGSFVEKGEIVVEIDKREIIGETKDLQLRGEHNWENVTAAVAAATLAHAKLSTIKKTVFGFNGLEHRLEFVGKYKGVNFYNDSFSTNPQTTIAAVKSFNEPLTLILGGSDKGLKYDEMAQEISANKNIKNIILIGQIADEIQECLKREEFQGKIVNLQMTTMEEVVKLAMKNTQNGGVVLLSPASASFGMFKDYKDRGKKFKEAVLRYFSLENVKIS